jgi:hypothetical protein
MRDPGERKKIQAGLGVAFIWQNVFMCHFMMIWQN